MDLNAVNVNTEKVQDLDAFREEWRRELASKSDVDQSQDKAATCPEEPTSASSDSNDDIHSKAREFFLRGVQLEENGKLYDAILYYKKAVNLVPDIEKEVFQYTGRPGSSKEKSNSGKEHNNKQPDRDNAQEATGALQNLVDKFSQIRLENKPLIQQEFQSEGKHISDLPVELLNYILKWVVSKDLDIRSLECCSQVCKGFYLAARDPEIWRQICERVFGASVLQVARANDTPWRDFYLSRSRVLFHGCYVSKMTYIREGERSFQDHENYRAWHMVQYFRLIRFFPGGRMLMCISADDPHLTAKIMNNKQFCSVQGSLFGEYRIQDNVLACVLHKTSSKKIVHKFRRKRRDAVINNDVPDQDFVIEFAIKGSRSRILQWRSYNIVNKYASGVERNSPVTLNESNFPRLKFVPVGSYHFESTSPL